MRSFGRILQYRAIWLTSSTSGLARRPTGLLDLSDELLAHIFELLLASDRRRIGSLLVSKRILQVMHPVWWRMLILNDNVNFLDERLDLVLGRPDILQHIRQLD